MSTVFEVSTRAHARMRVVRLSMPLAIAEAIGALDLPTPAPVLVLVGGAGSIGEAERARLRPLFVEGLGPAAEEAGAVVVDGGTDAGVMRLVGEARAKIGARFPLVGVAAAGTIDLPGCERGDAPGAAPVEPHHTHLVLVPGDHFGEESPWISDVAGAIADDRPSVTVVVGGGDITLEDVENSVAAGRPVIVIEGSGGTADALARARAGRQKGSRVARLSITGRLQIVGMEAGPAALREAIAAVLAGVGAAPTEVGAARSADDTIEALIASLPLPETKRRFLEGRWLDQIRWMEGKAGGCQRQYYRSRSSARSRATRR